MRPAHAGPALLRFLAIAWLTTTSGNLVAQGAPEAPVGARVRVRPPTGPRMAGSLVHRTADSIVIAGPAGERTFHEARGSVVEISAGRRANTLRGLGIGVITGGLAGVLLGLSSGTDGDGGFFEFTAGEKAAMGGIGGGILGGLAGTIIGSMSKSERWRPLPAVAAPAVTGLPGGRAGVGLAVAF